MKDVMALLPLRTSTRRCKDSKASRRGIFGSSSSGWKLGGGGHSRRDSLKQRPCLLFDPPPQDLPSKEQQVRDAVCETALSTGKRFKRLNVFKTLCIAYGLS